MPSLIIGPLLRHVDDTSAAIWVETDAPATVSVTLSQGEPQGAGQVWRAPTFAVHGHHYALVEVTGLTPGERTPYTLLLDDTPVWPDPHSPFPSPAITPVRREEPLRMAFGSCRTSVPHDADHHASHGVDALRTFALALARGERPHGEQWPMLLLLLGDQVYADETSEAMQAFIAARRSLDEPPGPELKDYEEYAHLYALAWSDPPLRWLLSTLPSLMIFDDHDVRDDWNTSQAWRQEMEATSWWHGRIVAALGSYWVHQHLGNLSVAERAEDELWVELQRRRAHTDGEVDLTDAVDVFAERVDREPDTYRWSYARDLGESRLVVVDSRAARVLDPEHRAMLDEAEMRWLDEQMRGDCRYLFVGTSLPFLLPRGLHDLEAMNESMVAGAWGRLVGRWGEKLRVEFDLEHWGAFHDSFERVARMVGEVAGGGRGAPPDSVVFLSGDVHHSYAARVSSGTGWGSGAAAVYQLVCSPIRNPLPRHVRWFTAALAHGVARPLGALSARSRKVPDSPVDWSSVRGPWYDNNLALVSVEDDALRVVWVGSTIVGEDHDHPRLHVVADVTLPPHSGRGF